MMSHGTLLAVLAIVALVLFSVQPSAADLQREALEALFKATGGPSWTEHTGWLEGDYCPEPVTGLPPWPGVVCDEARNVRHLNLERNNLRGTLPPGLFAQLPALEHANFAHNELTGTIPSSFCAAPRLTKLFLPINPSLGGTLHCMPPTLDTLIIEQTQVGGLLPQKLSGELRVLILSMSCFEGPIPDVFDSVPNLEILIMNGRTGEDGMEYTLKGPIPDSLWRLSKLEFLSLQFNHLEGTLGSFTKMKALQSLHLNNNMLSGTIPEGLVKAFTRPWTRLDASPDRHIHLENNAFTGTLSPLFMEMVGVTEVGLANNRFTGYLPPSFMNAKWQWFPEPASALASNDWLPPVPDWASDMGASPQPLQVQVVTPDMLASPAVNISIGGDSFVDLPNLGCAIAVKPVELGGPCESPNCITTPAVFDKVNVRYVCAPVKLEPDVLGSLSVTVVYTGDKYQSCGSDTHVVGNWVHLLVYHPHPSLEGISPSEGRWQGCTTVTLTGHGFVNTRKNFCHFGGPKAAAVEATVVSSTEVTCVSPGLASRGSLLYEPQFVVLSPNGGETFSQPSPGVTFTYTDFCPLSPPDPTTSCECHQCPCSGTGTCVWAHTRLGTAEGHTTGEGSAAGKPTYCICPPGFSGESCEKCLPGRWGRNCTECDCRNGGVCREGRQSDGSCKCIGWYIGKHCEIYYKSAVSILLATLGVAVVVCVVALMGRVLSRYCAAGAPDDAAAE
eukprot:RCo019434